MTLSRIVLVLGLAIGIASACTPACAQAGGKNAAAVGTCDRLAADPNDPDRPADVRGVLLGNIDATNAVAACRAAVKAAPGTRRLSYQLGRALQTGGDLDGARAAYQSAAAAGSANAMNLVGMMYDGGKGVPQDDATARQWFARAASAGNANAMLNLGAVYATGQGVPQDFAAARTWFEKSAATGNAEAMNMAGSMASNGQGGPKDETAARVWWQKAAAAGQPAAMNSLGNLLYNGQGLPRDLAAARGWWEKSAAAGNAVAMNSLGEVLRDGEGGPRDAAAARGWFEKSAAAGTTAALTNLAGLMTRGEGGPKDETAAHALMEKAAAAGDANALYNLGLMAENGLGTTRDETAARAWYEKAAAAGSTAAAGQLAAMNRQERGKADLFMAGIGGFWLLAGFGTILFGRRNRQRAIASAGWPQTEGKVVSAKVKTVKSKAGESTVRSYLPVVAYAYGVGGKSFTGKRLGFGVAPVSLQSEAEAILAAYPVGGPVGVFYDPGRPKLSTLSTSLDGTKSAGWIGLMLVLAGLGFAGYGVFKLVT